MFALREMAEETGLRSMLAMAAAPMHTELQSHPTKSFWQSKHLFQTLFYDIV